MTTCPKELHYTSTHEWVRPESGSNDLVIVGITDHAQHLLGDLVFVELPQLNTQVDIGQEVAVVESVKTAADVYSPVTGTVVAINEMLQNSPGLVNTDPYGQGWLFRLKITDKNQIEKLLTADHYQTMIENT